jgi:hypothetical protein
VAVPTFTSVSPNRGYPGGGQTADIVGTNFRVLVATIEVPQSTDRPTVDVTVGGIAAEDVRVVSDTLLRVNIPTARLDPNSSPAITDSKVSRVAFPAVDVVITNVDADGVAIPGETVTAAASYTYEQPLLRLPEGDPPVMQVTREFIRLLKKTVTSRIHKGTHTDFSVDGETLTRLSDHPTVGIRMTLARDDEYSHFDNEKALLRVGPVWQEFDVQRTVMVVYELTMSAKYERVAEHLLSRLIDTFMASPWLNVPADPDLPNGTENAYPLEPVVWPTQIGSIGRSNIYAYSATLRVRGVPILRGDPSRDAIRPITNITLVTSDMDATAPVQTVV